MAALDASTIESWPPVISLIEEITAIPLSPTPAARALVPLIIVSNCAEAFNASKAALRANILAAAEA